MDNADQLISNIFRNQLVVKKTFCNSDQPAYKGPGENSVGVENFETLSLYKGLSVNGSVVKTIAWTKNHVYCTSTLVKGCN